MWRRRKAYYIQGFFLPRDVVQSVWYNISALIRCIFIINRKITSYIYLLIFTISLWLHVKHFITLKDEMGKCENKIFACNYRLGLSLSTHRPVTPKTTGKYDSIGDKKEKKACVRMKYVKTYSYLTYEHLRKAWYYT